MNKNTLFQKPAILALLLVLAAFTGMMYFADRTLFWVQLAILLLAVAGVLLYSLSANRRVFRLLQTVSHALKAGDLDLMNRYPLPVAVTNQKGEIVWYSENFRVQVLDGRDAYGESIRTMCGGMKFSEEDFVSGKEEAAYLNKKYTVYAVKASTQTDTKILF